MVTYGNGTVRNITFDQRYRVTANALQGAAGPMASYTYGHDNVGNITSITDVVDPGYNCWFTYDELHRLTGATTGAALWGTGSYAYDLMGNVQSASGAQSRTFAYAGTTPKLSSVTRNGIPDTVAYDPAGNETTVGEELFTYSARNLLAGTSGAGWLYDGRGIRTVTYSSGGSVRRISLYTPELNLMAETETTGATQPGIAYEYVWFNGEPLAQIEIATGDIHWYFNDHLGAPVLQTSSTGQVAWRVEREPYGERYAVRAGAIRHQPLGLPGQEYDSTSPDLQYNIFRWYRAGWGRYTQADPMGLSGGINPYTYGANNPMSYVDRNGLKAEIVCGSIGIGLGPINLPSTPFRHCRILVTCEKCEGGKFGGPYDTSVGLERNRQSPKKELQVNEGPAGAGYTYRYPINGVDQNDSCEFGRCVRSIASTYQDDAARWTPQYSLFGPNSNSFAGHIMRWCGGSGPPGGPFGATGLNQPLGFQ